MHPHHRYVTVAGAVVLLALFPPLLVVYYQVIAPPGRTVEILFWLVRPASKEGRVLNSAVLTVFGPCVEEATLASFLTRNTHLADDMEIGELEVLTCHSGNEPKGDATALYRASTSSSPGFSCKAVPGAQFLYNGTWTSRCLDLKSHDVNLLNAKVRLSLLEPFAGRWPWEPVVDDRIRTVISSILLMRMQ